MLIVSFLLLNQNLPVLSHLCLLGLQGNVMEGGNVSGALCLSQAWPGMARTIYGDHQRFVDAYFKAYPGELLAWVMLCLYTHCWNLILRKPF